MKASHFILSCATAMVLTTNPCLGSNITDPNENNSKVYVLDKIEEIKFSIDPISYIENEMDFEKLLESQNNNNRDNYLVTFKCRLGSVWAEIDKNGDILNISQHFKNKFLPASIRNDIHSKYVGYSVASVDFRSLKKANEQREIYKVKIQKNGKLKTLKYKL